MTKSHRLFLLFVLFVMSCGLVLLFVVGTEEQLEPYAVTRVSIPSAATASPDSASASVSETPRVNINTASAAELDALPGIGEVLASRILAYREVNGPFPDIGALRAVDGIGDKTLEELAPYIFV